MSERMPPIEGYPDTLEVKRDGLLVRIGQLRTKAQFMHPQPTQLAELDTLNTITQNAVTIDELADIESMIWGIESK